MYSTTKYGLFFYLSKNFVSAAIKISFAHDANTKHDTFNIIAI